MKVVINTCFGGFGLSILAQRAYANRKGIALYFYRRTKYQFRDGANEYVRVQGDGSEGSSLIVYAHCVDRGEVFDGICPDGHFYYSDIPRTDPDLIAVIGEMGSSANGDCAKLAIVEIPDGVEFTIEEYDGNEHVWS